MATSDSTSVLSQIDGTCTVYDGSTNSLELALVQTDPEYTIEGAPYVEAMVRKKHLPIPVLRKTGDGNVTGSMSLLIRSFAGATAVTPYEVFTHTGLAASWTPTTIGDKPSLRLVFAVTDPSGASQTVTFAYLVASNVKIAPSGGDGLFMLTFDFTDHENAPVVA